MTFEELKAEALRQGYRLQKIPIYQCSCYCDYPNINHKRRNGKWKCVDDFEPVDVGLVHAYSACTHCRLKEVKDDKTGYRHNYTNDMF